MKAFFVGLFTGHLITKVVSLLLAIVLFVFTQQNLSDSQRIDQLTLRLRSGLELRLGGLRDVELKLAVAARVIPRLPDGAGYLDVSVPDRPVAGPPGLDPQVEVQDSTSTSP